MSRDSRDRKRDNSGDKSPIKKHSDRGDSHPRPSSQNGDRKDRDKEVRLDQVESGAHAQASKPAEAHAEANNGPKEA